jgi:FixJ family two-component response regulator
MPSPTAPSSSNDDAHLLLHVDGRNMPSGPVISIVDDDESSRTGLVRLVRSMGFVAHSFPTASAFLKSHQLSETSCLISDILMPDMTGIQLHSTLRARGHSIPIILITGFPDEKACAQALSRGAICYLSKPIESGSLAHCLNLALYSGSAL